MRLKSVWRQSWFTHSESHEWVFLGLSTTAKLKMFILRKPFPRKKNCRSLTKFSFKLLLICFFFEAVFWLFKWKAAFFSPQRLARSVLRRVCMCVVFPIGKKNSVLRSHLMTRSLCTGACNENQGCVPQQGRHIGLERADRFFQTLGPNHKWERSRRGRGLLTCEPRDPLNRMTWGKGVRKARHASRRSADCLQSETHGSCVRTHSGSSRVHFAALLFSPQMRPLPVADPCLLPLHTVIARQTNSAKVCASKPRNCLSARTKTLSLISFNTWPGHSIGLIYLINGWVMSALGIQLSKLDSLWMITNKKPPFLTTARFVFQFHTLLQWL